MCVYLYYLPTFVVNYSRLGSYQIIKCFTQEACASPWNQGAGLRQLPARSPWYRCTPMVWRHVLGVCAFVCLVDKCFCFSVINANYFLYLLQVRLNNVIMQFVQLIACLILFFSRLTFVLQASNRSKHCPQGSQCARLDCLIASGTVGSRHGVPTSGVVRQVLAHYS